MLEIIDYLHTYRLTEERVEYVVCLCTVQLFFQLYIVYTEKSVR